MQTVAARTATGGGPAGPARRESSVGLDISVEAEDEDAGAQVADGAAHHGHWQARGRHDRLPEVKGCLQQPVPAAAERTAHASGETRRVLPIRPNTTVSQSHRLSQTALYKRSTRRVGQGWGGAWRGRRTSWSW
jgi:hypothetical protein